MKQPIKLLITSAQNIDGKNAEIFGFWYYKGTYVPSLVSEKQQLFSDLMRGRCIQLNLSGSFQQILDLIWYTDRFNLANSESIKQFKFLSQGLLENPKRSISFEDVMSPVGSGLCLDVICDITETSITLSQKLAEIGDSISLTIKTDWCLKDEPGQTKKMFLLDTDQLKIASSNPEKTDEQIILLINNYLSSNYFSFIRNESLLIGRAIIPLKMIVDASVSTYRQDPTTGLANVIEHYIEYFQS